MSQYLICCYFKYESRDEQESYQNSSFLQKLYREGGTSIYLSKKH